MGGAALGGIVATVAFASLWLFGSPLTGRARAQLYATRMLHLVAPASSCDTGCAARLVGKAGVNRWLVRLTAPFWERCFVINLNAFRFSEEYGFRGVGTAACGKAITAPTPVSRRAPQVRRAPPVDSTR